MVHALYGVCAFVCALVSFILPLRMEPNLRKDNPVDKAFMQLSHWTVFFCLTDSAWGFLASDLIMNDTALFLLSTCFHLFAAFTPYVWLNFVLAYLGGLKYEKLYRIFTLSLFAAQAVLLIINFIQPLIFYVDENGLYATHFIRKILFYAQYSVYIIIAIFCIVSLPVTREGKEYTEGEKRLRNNLTAILVFIAAPIATGIFQLIYPDAPAYSIGYMLGNCIIYSFVVTDIIEARVLEKTVAQAANKAKSTVLFNMSHDIRTPMNAITGYTTLAKKHIDEKDKVEDCLNKIGKAGDSLLSLINQVLDMSRIESGKVELAEEPADIVSIAGEMIAIISQSAAAKNITVTSEQDVRDRNVFADSGRINQLLLNVLGNAVKYTPEGGSISCSILQTRCEKAGCATYVFTAQDTGIGMSREFLENIFEPFSRETTTTVSKIEGSGLGMAIVKRLVDFMGGDIHIESYPGKGTKVTIALTLKINPNPPEKKQGSGRSAGNLFKGRRILLVEDNEMNREIACELLTEQGIIVETAEDGDIAVQMMQKTADRQDWEYYDYVLMDVQMPRMNGYEATAAIRAIPAPEGVHTPIIAMTANAFEEDRRNAIASGMDEHLAKPIDLHKLWETLAKFN